MSEKLILSAEVLSWIDNEGAWYSDEDQEVMEYEEVGKDTTYTDLEKGYQLFDMKVKRLSDGKIFLFEELIDSPYQSISEQAERWEGIEVIQKPKKPRVKSDKLYTEQDIRDAVEHGLWAYPDFDRTNNYDEESRAEGLKEIQDDYFHILKTKKK